MRGKTTKRTQDPLPQQLYDSFLRKIPGFLYVAEVSEKEFKPVTCIGGFTSLTGFAKSNFLKPGFYNKMVAPGDLDSLQAFRNSIPGESEPIGINYHVTTRDGRKLLVNELVAPVENDGRQKLIGGIVTSSSRSASSTAPGQNQDDVLRLEEIQRINDRLLEANRLKDEFLANTSHELRTPLNSIIGFLTLMIEGYYENEDELRLFTRNALDSSYHLLNVINDLLDISKIEAGMMQVQIDKVYVNGLMDEIYSLFRVQADQKGLVFEYSSGPSPLFAAADIRKLRQVLINLTGNAIKFTSAGLVKLTVGARDGSLLFAVEDTGIGIPKDKVENVFQKFFQVDGSATRRYGGTGLGLAISKRLVEMLGGKIQIESNGAKTGTTVRFTIPKWKEEEK